jgi:hypothetical protein
MTSPMNVPTQNKNKSISHSPPLNVRNQQLVIKKTKKKKIQENPADPNLSNESS